MSELVYPSVSASADERGNLLIQKARPLLSLVQTDLSLAEFKIIDVYLSVINSHKPEENTVVIEKGQLEMLLDVTKILRPELEKRLHNLFQVIVVRDETNEDSVNGFVEFSLFEKAQAYQDKETGQWTVKLTATQSAMHYIFNIESLGYLRYRLRFVSDLKSRYTYCLYLYLKDNAFANSKINHMSWEVSVSDLKDFLNCKAKRYSQFKFFNAEILKKAREEINAKTDIYFDYETIKQGQYVRFIKFMVTDNDKNRTKKLMDENEEEVIREAEIVMANETRFPENLQGIANICGNTFASEMELSVIYNTLSAFVSDDDRDRQSKLLRHCYAKLLQRMNNDKLVPLRNVLSYFIMIIRNEAEVMSSDKPSEKNIRLDAAERTGLSELKKRMRLSEESVLYGYAEVLSYGTATIFETSDAKSVALYDLKPDERFEIIGYLSAGKDPVYHVRLGDIDGYIRDDFFINVRIVSSEVQDKAVIERSIANEKNNLEELKTNIGKTSIFVRGKSDEAVSLFQDAYLTVPMDLTDYTNFILLNANSSAEVVGCFDLSKRCKVYHIVDYGTANLYVDSKYVEII